MEPPRLRVVVAEDSTLVREGLLRVLENAGFYVVAVATDADGLLTEARALQPDVVITDIQMPPRMEQDGLDAALRLRRTHPNIGVIVLSQFLEDRYAFDLVTNCTDKVGYLLKDKIANAELLRDAVRRVAGGGCVLDPDVVARLVGRKRVESPLNDLTRRELEVLALMAEGRSNIGIAKKLGVTVPAVERHVTGIFGKLMLHQSNVDQHRRVLAVLKYLQS